MGIPSPRELYARLTSAEVTQWMAFYTLDPWGGKRDDLRSGILASVIANSNRGKNTKAFTPQDFVPDFDKPVNRKQTVEEQMAIVEQMKIALGDMGHQESED